MVIEFKTVRQAKEYLIGRIVDEAKSEGAPLTEVEWKMLYFTESGWTLPNMMAVSAEFDRDYDQDEYEQKIGGLVQRLLARDEAQAEQETWDDAVVKLADEDHYLLVLINAAPSHDGGDTSRWGRLKFWLPTSSSRGNRAPGDGVRLIAASVVGFALMMLIVLLKNYLKERLSF
jgi:hypothetical protein